MNREDFKIFIKCIGFKSDTSVFYYVYKDYKINLFEDNSYNLFKGSEWIGFEYCNNMEILERYFKKELRSFKLKQLLR